MVRRYSLLATLLVLAISILATTRQPVVAQTVDRDGRFQLFQGRYSSGDAGSGRSLEQQALFRIDTKTGATCYFLQAMSKDGRLIEAWMPVGEKQQ